MIKNVVVVCTGNICRSPVAEALLRHQLADPSVTVASAGIFAMVGHPADSSAQEVALDHGLDLSAHRARQLDRPMLVSADLVLALDASHQRWVTTRFPEFRGKIFKLGRWDGDRDIADPYQLPRERFEIAHCEIDACVSTWLKRLRV